METKTKSKKATGIKVEVKKEIPALKHILPLGFKTTIIPIRYEKRTCIVNERKRLNQETKQVELVSAAVYAEVGDYKDSEFKCADGNVYTTSIFGTRTMDSFFKKI